MLDLFAGTGALGFEALSRGAERAVFIDDGQAARALIRRNIDRLGVIGQTKLWRRDATRLGPCRGAPYGFVFADPPYGQGLGALALTSAWSGGWLTPGAVIVLEEAKGAVTAANLPTQLVLADRRSYGETEIWVLRAP